MTDTPARISHSSHSNASPRPPTSVDAGMANPEPTSESVSEPFTGHVQSAVKECSRQRHARFEVLPDDVRRLLTEKNAAERAYYSFPCNANRVFMRRMQRAVKYRIAKLRKERALQAGSSQQIAPSMTIAPQISSPVPAPTPVLAFSPAPVPQSRPSIWSGGFKTYEEFMSFHNPTIMKRTFEMIDKLKIVEGDPQAYEEFKLEYADNTIRRQ